jgi:hypothetical protein
MDPLSPELVLVDPELAQRARARLPELGASNGGATALPIARAADRRPTVGAGAVVRSIPSNVPRPVVRFREAAAPETRTVAAPRHAVRPKLLVVSATFVSFLLGTFIPFVVADDDATPSGRPLASTGEPPAAVIPHSAQSVGASRYSADRTNEAQAEGVQATRPGRALAKRKERARPGQSSHPAPSPQPRRRQGAGVARQAQVPTRLFVWLPSRGAHYYHVQFFKGTRPIFEAWPTDARVTVPLRGIFRGRRFAFTDGRYRWIVRPAFGPRTTRRYGEPIVRSIWVVRH